MTPLVRAFEGLPLWAGAIVVVAGFTIASVVLARLSQRAFQSEVLVEHNDLTGFIFAVVGVIYAVLLGFIAVTVWERFAAAEDATYAEAANVTVVYRDAYALAGGAAMRQGLRAYVRDIAGVEWPMMEHEHASLVVDDEAERLARQVNTAAPKTPQQIDVHRQMTDAMAQALVARERRLSIDSTGLNGLMWSIVILGGFITVAYSFLFGFKTTAMQTAMVGTLALIISLVIFLTMSLDYPYEGTVRVTPEAFERAATSFDTIDRAYRGQRLR